MILIEKTDHTIFGHVQERFKTRARALIYARLGLMAIGLSALAFPVLRKGLNLTMPDAIFWYVALLISHILSQVWIERRRASVVLYVSLCLDLVALTYLMSVSGGIHSGLLPAQLVFTMLFALLFPKPIAIIPPLLMLPILAIVSQIQGAENIADDLLLVLWYSALNITIIYVVVYLEGREKIAFASLMKLQREHRQQALANQRTSIAREIHDGVGAELSGILLHAEYLTTKVKGLPVEKEIIELRDASTEAIDELRRAVSILHREFMISTSIPDYVQRFAEKHRLEVEIIVRGQEVELAADVQLELFRIIQEALSNIARHAQATRIKLTIEFQSDGLAIKVEDDGIGFDPKASYRGHYGLRNMTERAAKIGGEVRFISEGSQGSSVEIFLSRG